VSTVNCIGLIQPLDEGFSKGLMTSQMTVKHLLDVFAIDHEVNRDVGSHRLPKIEQYISQANSENGIFFPSIVASYRGDVSHVYDTTTHTLSLPIRVQKEKDEGSTLYILDGQHRTRGLQRFVESNRYSDEEKENILESLLTIQIYFGLSIEDERKLFSDINSNGKRVSQSLATKYDSRDILNVFAKELYDLCQPLQIAGIEFEKGRISRPKSQMFTTSVRLKQFLSLVLFGRKELNKKMEIILKEQYDELLPFFDKLFTILFDCLPMNPGDVTSFVVGHEPLQNAIALYIHETIIVDREANSDVPVTLLPSWEEDLEQLIAVNWTVENKEWDPYMVSNKKYNQFISNSTQDLLLLLKRTLGLPVL
jgi:DNA sulfur modification protein DndB